jgi:hypothetical protein
VFDDINKLSIVFSVELAAEACTNHMYCGLGGGKQKQGKSTYSGVRCIIVGHWFPVNADCFVKCICTLNQF